MPDATDLAAALNECMPLTNIHSVLESDTEHQAECGDLWFIDENGDSHISLFRPDAEIYAWGLLAAECKRRGWNIVCATGPTGYVAVSLVETDGVYRRPFLQPGTDALAFARAFAAAKRAEGGGA